MRHSKIDCLVEEGGDQAIKEFLSKHYARIISIFDYYAGISSYPFISAHNLIDFARETKIIDDEVISETSFNRLVEEAIGQELREIQRFEFLKLLVLIACERESVQDPRPPVDVITASIEKLLQDLIYPNSKHSNDGENFTLFPSKPLLN